MSRIGIYRATAFLALLGAVTGGLLILKKNSEQQNLLPDAYFHSPALTAAGNMITTTTQATVQTTVSVTSQTTEQGYLLLLSENTLYVYHKGESKPVNTYSVAAAWLPDYDRILLENGLFVATAAELRQLLEDYTS